VLCDSGGGTSASVLRYGYVLLADHGGQLEYLGAIIPQLQREDAYTATALSIQRMGGQQVVVEERWHRHDDATCCPTGRATTEWTLESGRIRPGQPVVTR
jgi:hypothetical protein